MQTETEYALDPIEAAIAYESKLDDDLLSLYILTQATAETVTDGAE